MARDRIDLGDDEPAKADDRDPGTRLRIWQVHWWQVYVGAAAVAIALLAWLLPNPRR